MPVPSAHSVCLRCTRNFSLMACDARVTRMLQYCAHAHKCASAKVSGDRIQPKTPMARGPVPLKVEEPSTRTPGVPDELWAFPHNLAAWANKLGLFRADVAELASVAPSTVTRWMKFEIPASFTHVLRLEDAMKLKRGTLTRPLANPADVDSPALGASSGTDLRDIVPADFEERAEREIRAGMTRRVVGTQKRQKKAL